ncbi:DUF1833 family protein [Ponticoccus gilvus]|nr:DUF1833 family protein [Enemella evansiae]
MRRLPLNVREALEAEGSTEIPVVLIEIDHDALEVPIRLSTDNADLIETTEEGQVRGTRSRWRGADPLTQPYLHLLASVVQPSAQEQAPEAGTLVLENLHPQMAELILSYSDIATISLAAVMADVPDIPMSQSLGLEITSAVISGSDITITYTYENRENEPWPVGRMSRSQFPGLHE